MLREYGWQLLAEHATHDAIRSAHADAVEAAVTAADRTTPSHWALDLAAQRELLPAATHRRCTRRPLAEIDPGAVDPHAVLWAAGLRIGGAPGTVSPVRPEFESWGGFRGSVKADFAVSGRLEAF
jgi:hypothetical protein